MVKYPLIQVVYSLGVSARFASPIAIERNPCRHLAVSGAVLDKLPPNPDALLSAQEAKERLRELRATEAAQKGARSAAARRQLLR
jgi:hypothetical protein